jgi:hypothetical protein
MDSAREWPGPDGRPGRAEMRVGVSVTVTLTPTLITENERGEYEGIETAKRVARE